MEAGMPPGNTGNTEGTGAGLWPSMADRTLGWLARLVAGLDFERSWGRGGTAGREMEASLNRCSVKVELWWGSGVRGILVRKGRVGTM